MKLTTLLKNSLVVGDEVATSGFGCFRKMRGIRGVRFGASIALQYGTHAITLRLLGGVQPRPKIKNLGKHGDLHVVGRAWVLNFFPDPADNDHRQLPSLRQLAESFDQIVPGRTIAIKGVGIASDVADARIKRPTCGAEGNAFFWKWGLCGF